MRITKEGLRIAVKETIAESFEDQNYLLGAIVRIALFASEIPDTRQWETLPLWLEVARLPCPCNLKSYTVVFKNTYRHPLGTKTITTPISRNGNVFISFCRNIKESKRSEVSEVTIVGPEKP